MSWNCDYSSLSTMINGRGSHRMQKCGGFRIYEAEQSTGQYTEWC